MPKSPSNRWHAMALTICNWQTREEHEQIPEHVKDDESLAEGDQVVQRGVNQMAALRGDQILRQKIHHQIADPGRQKLQVGERGIVQPGKAEIAVIDGRSFHLGLLGMIRVRREKLFFSLYTFPEKRQGGNRHAWKAAFFLPESMDNRSALCYIPSLPLTESAPQKKDNVLSGNI